MIDEEEELKQCKNDGNLYKETEGADVKKGIVYMGFMSGHDLYVYWTPLSDGWYSYKYLDDIIDNGEAEFKGVYKIFGYAPAGVKLYEPEGE